MDKRFYAWDLTLTQLERVQELRFSGYFHIIHILYDDLTDHYVVLAECEPRIATWVELL
jgi:hypothetical protein